MRSPILIPHSRMRWTPLALEAAEGIVDLRPYAARNVLMRVNLTSPQKPCIENLVEMVRKRINEDKLQSHGGIGSSILRISDSLLSSEIMSHRFSKKLVILSFDCYTGVTDPV